MHSKYYKLGDKMFKKIENILIIIGVALGVYIIASSKFTYLTLFNTLISAILVIRGVKDLKENQKRSGIANIAVGIVFFIVAIMT